MDANKLRFKAKLLSAAIRKSASIEGSGADSFVDMLYAEWSQLGKPIEHVAGWLDERLDSAFLSLNESPKWVESEPAWAYHQGQPMVF